MLITLLIEDNVSRSVGRRLIDDYLPSAQVYDELVAGGSIRNRISGMNQRAMRLGPVLAIADLDRPMICPADLVSGLSGGLTIAPNLLIRIAVMEIEAWLMADGGS